VVEVRRNAESSMSVLFSEVPGDDAQSTEDRAYFITYSVLEILKVEIPGIVFGIAELADVTLSGSHHALVNDPFARKCKQARSTIRGEFVSVDASKGLPETEFNHPNPVLNRDNCLRYHRVVEDVSTGKMDLYSLKDDVSGLSLFIRDELNTTLNDFAVNLQAHTNTAKANLVAADALNNALARFDSLLTGLFWPVDFILKLLGKKNGRKGKK
jgi:hypothetical protein